MDLEEIYVVCQIEDFCLKVMANSYANNQIHVLFKENIAAEQFAENGIVIDPTKTAEVLKSVIKKINETLKTKIIRISLSLPSNNLKIYQSQALLDFKDINHKITNEDITKVVEMSKNIIISNEEVICLTKPYSFRVDHQSFQSQPSFGTSGQTLFVKSLIYSLPKTIFQSHLETIRLSECQLLSVTLDQFALMFNINSQKVETNNIILIDWGQNNTKVSVFFNSALYAINNIKIGYNQIVHSLINKMRCSYSKAEKFLTKVVNITGKNLGDVILERYFDSTSKKFVNLSKNDLQAVIKYKITEIIENIEYFLNEIQTSESEFTIISTGYITNLPGFSNFIRNYEKLKNMKFITSNTLGINNSSWTKLIGVTHYQHQLNLYNNNFLTSVNEITINEKAIIVNNKLQENTVTLKAPNLQYHYNK